MITRRHFNALTATSLIAAGLPAQAGSPMHVLTSPSCGCCHAWADLARARGYAVTVEELTDPEAQKLARGIPRALASCHTIETEGYIFEGHVPFDALEAVLRDRPAITGLAVPGMPMGSPGMGDDPTARYDVIAFGGEAGAGKVFYRSGTAEPFDT
ncbi:DUF411 domain-containing protein [uncultured Tateyamaria sp.]|uniref:DUF411 domain-containing protein n=1 Tax=uncultured Tateyamaria sp. TaxID=455651 RepID=UPI00260D6B67|nr:DUF411 domain-containing protein [uncultured Tateyamaria sp.]